ncbi:hypothetical protein KIW84_032468 [Lathyrus oleraceus]|uniref:Uncharacterized protein n=1 Tax=Pisum sativum TaxID=3888 RepID=A0A9D4XT74_PEA|nr:hypothetical protein KIW84_032468 [Pisum sativum]
MRLLSSSVRSPSLTVIVAVRSPSLTVHVHCVILFHRHCSLSSPSLPSPLSVFELVLGSLMIMDASLFMHVPNTISLHWSFACNKMANQDDTHAANESRNNVEKEIKRGLTVMKSIIRARDKGVKFEVHWSAEDQLIEPNGSMLASYIGFLVRQHIPITCDNWRSPDLKVGKEKIWSEIQRSFHIDESRQKYCIQLAGKRL